MAEASSWHRGIEASSFYTLVNFSVDEKSISAGSQLIIEIWKEEKDSVSQSILLMSHLCMGFTKKCDHEPSNSTRAELWTS